MAMRSAQPEFGNPIPERPRFCSTEHLSSEAVAAFVDGELSASAMRRARDHAEQCSECSDEISTQRVAAERVRSCASDGGIRAPQSLIQKLSQLCDDDWPRSATQRESHESNPSTVNKALRALKWYR